MNQFNLKRRDFLIGSGGGIAALALSTWGVGVAHADPESFARLLDNWRNYLVGANLDPGIDAVAAAVAELDGRVQGFVDQLVDAPDRVFDDEPLTKTGGATESGRMHRSMQRLDVMAQAWSTPGSAFFDDPEFVETIVANTRFLHEYLYNAAQPAFGNWWSWEIGAAQPLMNICVLLRDHIDAALLGALLAAIDHFIPDIMLTRRLVANRIDLCQSVLLRGALGGSVPKIELAREKLLELFVTIEDGNGFYEDGSYVDHNTVAYTGTYGAVFLRGFIGQVLMLLGTQWELDEAATTFVANLVDETFSPMIYDGLVFDNVRGRAVGRANASSRDDGHVIVALIAMLAGEVGGTRGLVWRERVRGWLERDQGLDPRLAEPDAAVQRTLAEVMALHQILADGQLSATPEPLGTQVFGGMARAVHRRGGWAASISMSSERIAHYEGYTENLRGWHTGSGMVQLHNRDGQQFTDDYWPTADPYHHPGTTTDQRVLADGQNGGDRDKDMSSATWAGGAVLDDVWAAVGLDLDAMASSLRARKSWFCLEDQIIALGSGITMESDQVRVPAVMDTYVNGGALADTNYGKHTSTVVSKKSTLDYTRESLIRFEPNELAGEPDATTHLNLYAYVHDGSGTESVVAVYEVLGDWQEMEVTWNTKPELGERLGQLELNDERVWREFDISAHARSCAERGVPVDLAFVAEHPAGMPGVSVTIFSRERTTEGPFLVVTAPPTSAVHTTVENRLVHDGQQPAVVVDGQQLLGEQFQLQLEGAHWVHVEGVGGYVLLAGDDPVTVSRQPRTGSWSDISVGSSTNPITRSYISMVTDHGVGPVGASYAYAMLPDASPAQTQDFLQEQSVIVLANTPAQHGVQLPNPIGVTAVNFWEPGQVGPLTVDKPCSVVMRQHRGQTTLAVSGPGSDDVSVTIQIERPAKQVSFDGGARQAVAARDGRVTTVVVPLKSFSGTTHVQLHP